MFTTKHPDKNDHFKSECRKVIQRSSVADLHTRPCFLPRQSEAVALRVGVTDVRCLSGTVDRQHAALLAVGRPAAVLHVPGCPHTLHHSVI